MLSHIEVKQKLEVAFRRLEIRTDAATDFVELTISGSVDALSRLRGKSPAKPPAIYVGANHPIADAERLKISKLSRELASTLTHMHSPTFQMFADSGFMKNDLDALISGISSIYRIASNKKVNESEMPAKKGRPRNNKNHMIRAIINKTYYDLTGEPPSQRGDFKDLCFSIAFILDLGVQPNGFARQAYNDFHKKQLGFKLVE